MSCPILGAVSSWYTNTDTRARLGLLESNVPFLRLDLPVYQTQTERLLVAPVTP